MADHDWMAQFEFGDKIPPVTDWKPMILIIRDILAGGSTHIEATIMMSAMLIAAQVKDEKEKEKDQDDKTGT